MPDASPREELPVWHALPAADAPANGAWTVGKPRCDFMCLVRQPRPAVGGVTGRSDAARFHLSVPFQTLFATVNLPQPHWLPILGGAILVFLLVEAEKAIFRHRRSFRT